MVGVGKAVQLQVKVTVEFSIASDGTVRLPSPDSQVSILGDTRDNIYSSQINFQCMIEMDELMQRVKHQSGEHECANIRCRNCLSIFKQSCPDLIENVITTNSILSEDLNEQSVRELLEGERLNVKIRIVSTQDYP